jgi:hypothetical protein
MARRYIGRTSLASASCHAFQANWTDNDDVVSRISINRGAIYVLRPGMVTLKRRVDVFFGGIGCIVSEVYGKF